LSDVACTGFVFVLLFFAIAIQLNIYQYTLVFVFLFIYNTHKRFVVKFGEKNLAMRKHRRLVLLFFI